MSNYPDGMSRSNLRHVGGEEGCESCKCGDEAQQIHDDYCDEESCVYCEHGKDLHVDDMVCEIQECDCRAYEAPEECNCDCCNCICHQEPSYD